MEKRVGVLDCAVARCAGNPTDGGNGGARSFGASCNVRQTADASPPSDSRLPIRQ